MAKDGIGSQFWNGQGFEVYFHRIYMRAGTIAQAVIIGSAFGDSLYGLRQGIRKAAVEIHLWKRRSKGIAGTKARIGMDKWRLAMPYANGVAVNTAIAFRFKTVSSRLAYQKSSTCGSIGPAILVKFRFSVKPEAVAGANEGIAEREQRIVCTFYLNKSCHGILPQIAIKNHPHAVGSGCLETVFKAFARKPMQHERGIRRICDFPLYGVCSDDVGFKMGSSIRTNAMGEGGKFYSKGRKSNQSGFPVQFKGMFLKSTLQSR